MKATKPKKNLKPKAVHNSVGNGAIAHRGRSQYEFAISLGNLSPQSAETESLQASGNDGRAHLSNGAETGSPADASTRQKTALMLVGLLMESQKLGLCRIFRAQTKQGHPCIKVTMELTPSGEWELVGNEIRFVGS